MTRHKIIVRTKGGPGSGHHGHSGLPGVHGGSRPGKGGGGGQAPASKKATSKKATPKKLSTEDVVKQGNEEFSKIMADPQMRRMAVGLAADGSIDDVANVTAVVDGVMQKRGAKGPAPYSDTLDEESDISNNRGVGMSEDLWEEYETATGQAGYYVKLDRSGNPIITEDRKAWERYYYGREVGGFHEGDRFATEALQRYLETGEKPDVQYPNAKAPKKAKRGGGSLDSEPAPRKWTPPNKSELQSQLEYWQGSLQRTLAKPDADEYASYIAQQRETIANLERELKK